ncbi:MAG TPA: hypothetical protein VFT50_01060 [Baekduia sp.]|nr:hypothetical protein [Baekduia sp.]
MRPIASHLAVAALAVSAGSLGAAVLAPREASDARPVVRRLPPGPEHVRTVVETHVIHRTRHVRAHGRPQPAAAPPPPAPAAGSAPAAPAAPAVQPAVAPATAASAPVAVTHEAPLQTRTSGAPGASGGGHENEHEHEGGGDD